MSKLQQTAVATTTEEVVLQPKVRRALLAQLRRYEALTAEIRALKAQTADITAKVRELRESTGYGSLDIEGFKVTNVVGTYTKYNDKKLLTWISTAQLAEAKETRPRKAYERISVPGAADESEE